MRNFLLGALAVMLIGGIGGGAYLLGKQVGQKVISPQVTPTPTTNITQQFLPPTPLPTSQAVNDNELIKQALFTKHGWKEGEMIVKVSTNDGKYASGTASSSGGGGYFYAAKVNGTWEIVADGNGVILCSSLIKYPDFPKTLIPECFDQATGKTLKR